MKKLILISLLTLGFMSLSFAGGDDRDQELPLNSLNTVVDDTSLLSESDQNKQASDANTADLEQLLKEIEKDLNDSTELDQEQDKGYIEIFKENYIDSYSGRFILLGVFVLIYCFLCLSLVCFSQESDLSINNSTKSYK